MRAAPNKNSQTHTKSILLSLEDIVFIFKLYAEFFIANTGQLQVLRSSLKFLKNERKLQFVLQETDEASSKFSNILKDYLPFLFDKTSEVHLLGATARRHVIMHDVLDANT
jgi:hypothetical protein